jgi:PadR family transcriptional regulator, regulatory protein PadR
MPSQVRVTAAVAQVLAVFLEDITVDQYGLDLMRASNFPSGTLYPILLRLEKSGWLTSSWESVDPVAAGRPARRYYRLTPHGVEQARTEIAALQQRLSRVPGLTTKPRTA